jgi:hypothetical protein
VQLSLPVSISLYAPYSKSNLLLTPERLPVYYGISPVPELVKAIAAVNFAKVFA